MKIFLRTPYNYDMDKASEETGLDCQVEPSLTHQSFAEECDINTIIRRFGLGGQFPVGLVAPTYGDFSGIDDYQSALNAIIAADEKFMELPAQVRSRFHNDAAEFVAFCSDEKNREEAVKMGLVLPKAAELVKSSLQADPAEPDAGA